MAESLKTLRRRIRTIVNIQQVTRAMEMVSAAKLRRTQGMLIAARPYARQMQQLLGRLAPVAESIGHPDFQQRDVKRITLVLFTADRGLCGSYNGAVIRGAEEFLAQNFEKQVEIVCVGRRGYGYFSKRQVTIAEKYLGMGGNLVREESDKVAAFIHERFRSKETDSVQILYNKYISTAVYRPTLEQYLPVSQEALLEGVKKEDQVFTDYIFEPSQSGVLNQLVPEYLASKIFITLAEALTAEHSARMLAMNNATKNCDELRDGLTLKLNKARQSAITGDLLDIVGGAEALKG